MCVLEVGETVSLGKLGPPPKDCCLCTDSKSIKQQPFNSRFLFYFLSFSYLNGDFRLSRSAAVPSLPLLVSPTLPHLASWVAGRGEEWDC